MKTSGSLLLAFLLTGSLVLSAIPIWGAEGAVKVSARPGNYCHMKFPAIREDTLSWDHPVLKDPSSGDIIDYYGSCNHDPVGKDEIRAQQIYRERIFLQSE